MEAVHILVVEDSETQALKLSLSSGERGLGGDVGFHGGIGHGRAEQPAAGFTALLPIIISRKCGEMNSAAGFGSMFRHAAFPISDADGRAKSGVANRRGWTAGLTTIWRNPFRPTF